jgi:hypothetical protein
MQMIELIRMCGKENTQMQKDECFEKRESVFTSTEIVEIVVVDNHTQHNTITHNTTLFSSQQ